MRAGCQVNTLEHSDTVNSVDFSPDGTQIVSGSDDGLLKIFSVPWDAATGAKVSSFVGMRRGWVGAGGCLGVGLYWHLYRSTGHSDWLVTRGMPQGIFDRYGAVSVTTAEL